MKTVLVLAHPNMKESIYNKTLVEALEKQNYKNVIIHDLYKLYPDFNIDIKAEQNLLLNADKIIFETPVYWYNMTPLLKKWMDDVFEHGWAYGHNGTKLHGKKFGWILTAGASEQDYREAQPQLPSLESCFNFLIPTIDLIGGKLLDPYIVYGAEYNREVKDVLPSIPGYLDYITK